QEQKQTKETNDFLSEFNRLQQAKQMKGDLNPVLENLKQRDVQQAPVKLIYADTDFAVFDKGAKLTEKDFKTLPPVFSCKLGIILDEVFYTIYNKKKMKQALQGPSHQAALIDRLIDSMKTKATTTLNKKL
ncbi:1897_t:CDS:2, partial [Racocetra persica]